MSDNDRHRIERLLQQSSRILDPSERSNANWASTMQHFRHGVEQQRKSLMDVSNLDHAALNERVGQLLARAVR